jgi:cobalamin synthase
MSYRAGIFFLIIGFLLIFYFIMTYFAEAASALACLGGVLSLSLGLVLYLRHRPPAVQSERFQTWKKFTGRNSRRNQ